jgi:hypothetical protein
LQWTEIVSANNSSDWFPVQTDTFGAIGTLKGHKGAVRAHVPARAHTHTHTARR